MILWKCLWPIKFECYYSSQTTHSCKRYNRRKYLVGITYSLIIDFSDCKKCVYISRKCTVARISCILCGELLSGWRIKWDLSLSLIFEYSRPCYTCPEGSTLLKAFYVKNMTAQENGRKRISALWPRTKRLGIGWGPLVGERQFKQKFPKA